jgi:hypothetical protein
MAAHDIDRSEMMAPADFVGEAHSAMRTDESAVSDEHPARIDCVVRRCLPA